MHLFSALLPALAPWVALCFIALLVFCGCVVRWTGTTRSLRDVAALLAVIFKPWRRR